MHARTHDPRSNSRSSGQVQGGVMVEGAREGRRVAGGLRSIGALDWLMTIGRAPQQGVVLSERRESDRRRFCPTSHAHFSEAVAHQCFLRQLLEALSQQRARNTGQGRSSQGGAVVVTAIALRKNTLSVFVTLTHVHPSPIPRSPSTRRSLIGRRHCRTHSLTHSLTHALPPTW
jgi:hypothetical protein